MPLDTQNLRNSDDFNALEQNTDIAGTLSVLVARHVSCIEDVQHRGS